MDCSSVWAFRVLLFFCEVMQLQLLAPATMAPKWQWPKKSGAQKKKSREARGIQSWGDIRRKTIRDARLQARQQDQQQEEQPEKPEQQEKPDKPETWPQNQPQTWPYDQKTWFYDPETWPSQKTWSYDPETWPYDQPETWPHDQPETWPYDQEAAAAMWGRM